MVQRQNIEFYDQEIILLKGKDFDNKFCGLLHQPRKHLMFLFDRYLDLEAVLRYIYSSDICKSFQVAYTSSNIGKQITLELCHILLGMD